MSNHFNQQHVIDTHLISSISKWQKRKGRILSLSLLILGLLVISCEDPDTTPPTIQIITPTSGAKVSEVVDIVCLSSDNIGVEKLELWVDAVRLDIIDESEPYSLQWNTVEYDDSTSHTISVRAYDVNGNTTDSSPITVEINQGESFPKAINITNISYTYEAMTISWEESRDDDFGTYELLYAESESGAKTPIVTISAIDSTVFTIMGHDPTHENWFWVKVTDLWGLSVVGVGSTNEIDQAPQVSTLFPIEVQNDSYLLKWSRCLEGDFEAYQVYVSSANDMINPELLHTSESYEDTSFTILGIEKDVSRYYQISTIDQWGQESFSNVEVYFVFSGFAKPFGGEVNEHGNCVRQTMDGGFIVLGSTSSYGSGMWLIKTDGAGNQVWSEVFNGYSGTSIKETNDGGYIIVGQTAGCDILLLKTNSEGQEEWIRTYGGDECDLGSSVCLTSDGGYILSGSTLSAVNGNGYDQLLIKTDASGIEEWSQSFNRGLGGYVGGDYGFSAQQTMDNGYIVLGYSMVDSTSVEDMWLIKTDDLGNMEWDRVIGGEKQDIGYSVQQTVDGGFMLCGSTQSFGNGYKDAWLMKTDNQGIEEWNVTFGGINDDRVKMAEQTSDGGYVMIGSIVTNEGNVDMWLIKTDESGNLLWENTYGGPNGEIGRSVQQTVDGAFILTGTTYSFGNGAADLWLVKTDVMGNYTLP